MKAVIIIKDFHKSTTKCFWDFEAEDKALYRLHTPDTVYNVISGAGHLQRPRTAKEALHFYSKVI